ncbi:MAG: transglutaminase family protein [Minwuia sp.]|nr:transglutaminase family protein [Minwuia sp.]
MPIHAALNHKTIYNYDRKVTLSPQTIRLRPAAHTRTNILSYSLRISPENHFINWQQDPLGNYMARVVFPEPVDHFHVEVDMVAEMAVLNPFDFFLEEYAERFPFAYEPGEADSLEPYLDPEPAGPELQKLIDGIDRSEQRTIDFLFTMNQQLQSQIGYVVRMEPGVQTPEETLGLAKGSCRDTAWLMVQVLRHMGLAARFASGYLIQLQPDQKPLEGPTGPESDFTDLHAWAEVYLPGAGWIGLDATSGLLAGEGHIPLACAPSPTSAAPITGRVGASEVEFSHEMTVTRIYESARVTKPFSDDAWSRVDALGQDIEAKLVAGDVRLTMGGEPTFVSIDDMDGEEWNTDALGPTKRKLAFELIKRVRNRFAPDGLLTFGQGKQYPGEPLPRWAFGLFWRNDGLPIWDRADLIASEDEDYRPTVEDAETFIHLMCDRLDVNRQYAIPAFEDPLVHLKAEQQLPINLNPDDPAFKKDQDRSRLADVLRRGLDQPKAYVLPVMRGHDKDGEHWITGPWEFKAGYMFLLPGDSPVGFRLPLGALPHLEPDQYPSTTPVDPYSIEGPLPVPAELAARVSPRTAATAAPGATATAAAGGTAKAAPAENVSEVVRTAMVVEPRAGRLNLFLPPTVSAEDYLELIAAAEDAAVTMNMPIHIEGYEPPPDPRISVIRVTPDPGVIEVNVHPATDWSMLTSITKGIYEEARQTRLGTEKFMVDGRHIGTGGGNHIVVGGARPADSPFLRRPDLLGSLIRYWQNHPSLSYLFSGMFIGPTSQAPRVDEARDDTLYELEIALSQLPKRDEDVRPWTVDRMLRNLLIDLTGNTHRSEICIDKLYSPSGPTGRLGLVEFRGFEMPPHAEMSLAQQLLLRGLIARFWEQPYTRPLIRHGDALRDRHMLPYYAWRDFESVIAEMQEAGFAFDAEWYRAQFEFRFPRMGEATYHGMEIEIRNALEPWHVLGEESGSSGTARYVDSSLERVQVQISGLSDPGRYMVACNGRHVPLAPTSHAGTWVGGVRYKAWAPYSALHPMIDIHSPLTFDLIDTWSGRSVGGCRYHVVHPGGRNYETSPVNGEEAEGRRLSRFEPIGHSPGQVGVPVRERNERFPHTLDLRAPIMPA